MDILTVTLRQIQRDEGKAVAVQIAEDRPVKVDDRAYIVPAGWLDIKTDESPLSCSDLGSRIMQIRTSKDEPIPLRFGRSSEARAWLISLARWRTMDKPEEFSD